MIVGGVVEGGIVESRCLAGSARGQPPLILVANAAITAGLILSDIHYLVLRSVGQLPMRIHNLILTGGLGRGLSRGTRQ